MAEVLLMLTAIGAFAGVLAGLLGVGGGIVLVPAFFYVFSHLGYDGPGLMQVCLATSLATIMFTSARSVMAHHAKGAVDWQILRSWAPGIALGAMVGVFTVAQLRSDVLVGIFGVLGLIIGIYMALGRDGWQLGAGMPVGVRRVLISPVIGLLSVVMGIGGGSFGVPLMRLHGVSIHRAVATAAGFGVIIALPSMAGFLWVRPPGAVPPWTLGAINVPAFGVITAMTFLTAPLGVRLAHAMNPAPLKRVFAAFLILVALNMLRMTLWG